MFFVKPCMCGSTEFERESDDDVLRCSHCFSLAVFGYKNNEKKSEDENNGPC